MCISLKSAHIFRPTLDEFLRLQLNDVMDEQQRIGARLALLRCAAVAKCRAATAARGAIQTTIDAQRVQLAVNVGAAAFAPSRCEC